MAKYLDYEGLKILIGSEHSYIENITGKDYKIADTTCNIKEYIDSRIFVGSAADVELALSQKKIDDTAFTMVVDEDASEVTSISDSEINSLFS